MTNTNVCVSEYADELIETPRAHLRLTLEQDAQGLVLTYQGRDLLRCYLTSNGMLAGGFVAQSLGVRLPPLGESVVARVSTGVLYRVLGVCQLGLLRRGVLRRTGEAAGGGPDAAWCNQSGRVTHVELAPLWHYNLTESA